MEGFKINLENEVELVERAKTDEAAFTLLYNHYFPRIYGYIFKRTGNREVSEDVLSATFLKAFTNLKKYQSRGFSFGAWLYRIATNNLTDYYRRNKNGAEISLEDVGDSLVGKEDSTDDLGKKQDRLAIEKAFSCLPARYREVLQLRYFAELDIEEVAETLKISKVHASVLIHRALKCFKNKYQE
jgi:RNA polymerase sigma-70 factor (ECF subfamily)